MRLLSFSSIALLQLSFITALHGTKWTYAGPEGQDHWDENYPYCGGAFQSPINIKSELMRFDTTLRPINVRNYNLSPNEQLTFGNNGHSVQLSLPSKMYISGLPHYYSAAQLHFHWGSSSKPMGSEHLVNNKQYAAEMHIVHYNSDKYPNISMAVDKSDGLAVLGVLIEVGEFNPAFEQFLKFLNGIKYRDQKVQVPGFNIRSLLPTQLNEYYRYDGSLTTPPCYPSVLWTVFRNPVTLSHEQYMALATTLFSSHAQDSVSVILNSNYRKPQPMDSRIVLVSFKEGKGLHSTPTVTSPMRRKQIVQQLLVGDLADLADEWLHQLLPGGSQKFHHGWKKDDIHDTAVRSKQHMLNWSPVKKSHNVPYAGKLGLAKEAMCYVCIEEKVLARLIQSHAETRLVQTLKDTVYPQLCLRSYLESKSDLSLLMVRHILKGRPPTDEANELDLSLRKALKTQKQKAFGTAKERKNSFFGPAVGPKRPHSWVLPMEWED
ncbi:carbonic anhydrase 12 isoform X1 [Takifugu rubripes]|uniref:Carbonic anhydrase n=1 Tax=Takifugu rubripes TaxID=31033 RepID=H2U9F3_TAKRU|nr:carbonic anhydrase 12 isoform X1 [Takifugu rubripes]